MWSPGLPKQQRSADSVSHNQQPGTAAEIPEKDPKIRKPYTCEGIEGPIVKKMIRTAAQGKGKDMKRLTYHNLLKGIKIMQGKGYSFEEAEDLARKQFDKLEADTTGFWTFEKLAAQVISKEEYEALYK